MKPFVFTKKASIALMTIGLFCVLSAAILYGYSTVRYAADEAQTPVNPDYTVEINPTMNNQALPDQRFILGMDTNISVDLKLKRASNPAMPAEGINHVALYRTPPGSLINPINTDAGKQIICDRINRQNEPLVLINKVMCLSEGDCQTVNYMPGSEGYIQLFAVAMKSDTGQCTTDKIAGWSIADQKHFIDVATGTISSGSRVELSMPSKVYKGHPFQVIVMIKGAGTPINHVSVLLSKKEFADSSATAEDARICTQAELSNEDCELCFQKTSNCSANGICEPITVTSNQLGFHRLLGVAISTPTTTACTPGAPPAGNVVEIIKDKKIETIEPRNLTPPAPGTGDPDSGSSDPDTGNPPGPKGSLTTPRLTNPTVIESVTDVLMKFRWFAYTFIGILAFASIIYGGITLMSSASNEQQIRRAKNAIAYAILGIVIVFLAWGIVTAVVDTLNNQLFR